MSQQSEPPSPPRPLFYGWVIVIASFVILFAYVFMSNSAGVFFKPMLKDLGWSRGMTAGAFSISMLVTGLSAPAMGALTDKYGPRVMAIACACLLAAGYGLTSLTGSLVQLYVSYGLIIGLASASMWTPVAATVARWFEARRGFALSLVQVGAGLGTVIGPPLASYIIYRFDWRQAFLILGLSMALLTFISAQFFRRSPQAMGLLPDGGKREPSPAARVSRIVSGKSISVTQALKQGAFWRVFCAIGLAGFAQQIIVVHLVAAATDKEITPTVAATFVSVLGITNMIGKLVMGVVSDRLGRRISLTISLSLGAAAMLWLAQAREPWMFYTFAVFWGFAFGSWIPLFPALTGDLFGVSSLGGIFGLVTLGNYLGGATGAFLAGVIFDRAQSYTLVFILATILLVVGVSLILAIKDPKRTGQRGV